MVGFKNCQAEWWLFCWVEWSSGPTSADRQGQNAAPILHRLKGHIFKYLFSCWNRHLQEQVSHNENNQQANGHVTPIANKSFTPQFIGDQECQEQRRNKTDYNILKKISFLLDSINNTWEVRKRSANYQYHLGHPSRHFWSSYPRSIFQGIFGNGAAILNLSCQN
jgi:hypothetical protein